MFPKGEFEFSDNFTGCWQLSRARSQVVSWSVAPFGNSQRVSEAAIQVPVGTEYAFHSFDSTVSDREFAILRHNEERCRNVRVPAIQLHSFMPIASRRTELCAEVWRRKHRLKVRDLLGREAVRHEAS